MRCPSCGLYHPSQYDHCISCGTQLAPERTESIRAPVRFKQKPQLSPAAGIGIAICITAIAAVITFFLLRPDNDSILYKKAEKELSSGQYAFAVKLLEQLAARKPGDARVFLALARAYVGIDQVDRAWAAIGHAQQLGQGVIADPALTYQLAYYYRQHGDYNRAVQLLRPLASANIADARAQLSDLDAAWGDEQLGSNIEQAMRCWEEVQSLNTGSRLSEAPARLSTIYSQYADKLAAQGDDKAALAVLIKLNAVAQNSAYHAKTADVYERLGQFDQACDQLRTAISLAGPQSELNARLAVLLTEYGKQLLDSGDTERGYGCLQQAADLDKTVELPQVVLKDVSTEVDPVDRHAQLYANVYNAGQTPVGHAKVDAQLVSTATSKVLWQGSQLVVGEYEPSLAPQSSKAIKFDAIATARSDGSAAFNIYIDHKFYKSYTLGKKTAGTTGSAVTSTPANRLGSGGSTTYGATTNAATNSSEPVGSQNQAPRRAFTPEDQTLKDLER